MAARRPKAWPPPSSACPPAATSTPCRSASSAYHELQRRFDEFSGPRPGTTLTLLDLPPDAPALLWHAGDSRLYEIKGSARPLTIDHVPATALALEGLVDQETWCRQVLGTHTPQITQAFIL
ncbi:hypothetical protein HN295_20305, partial [Acinetobacter baumannii]|nr:hypothetical protein [Acinetobacter baumannii]